MWSTPESLLLIVAVSYISPRCKYRCVTVKEGPHLNLLLICQLLIYCISSTTLFFQRLEPVLIIASHVKIFYLMSGQCVIFQLISRQTFFFFGIKNELHTAQCVGIPLLNTPHFFMQSNETLEQTSVQYSYVFLLLLERIYNLSTLVN